MKKYTLTLDLKDDESLIAAYITHHQQVWPEILDSIKESGIHTMEIYQVANRLFMMIEADEEFSFQRKNEIDEANPKVQEWEQLMDQYQARLPFATGNEKWVLMNKIFEL
ncbi:L-rhamnose mutarotase [Reichenbachiella agarivorans]|uniref:L-rhamnose mutarotase n=1 Tax=Reichenbachiella agarivorans TaxID=2979464 RepID=A0ABY6CQ29_9BACT|nr:L-rhamnose mutarotase [Reichenbachiella agarivorans]UXP32626.1 L-rhamnose mutarotase [Reichenbachiella agarivorans]